MSSKRHAARREMLQQRIDAGVVGAHFPGVAGIVISMIYTQRGAKPMLRTVNFSPGSSALFRIDCLSRDCVEGGFDLTQVITAMIRSRQETAKGELNCEGEHPDHSSIVYEVAIHYV
jgi:hypothetical protein